MTVKPIVVGYDGSSGSEAALRWALAEARLRRAPLRLVYATPTPVQLVPPFGGFVIPDDEAREEAGAAVLAAGAAAARAIDPEVHVDVTVAEQGPTVGLLADSDAMEMIVVGSRGLGGFSDLLVGSTSVQLATHAACPVIVIRPAEPARTLAAGPDVGRIVVGVDGSPVSAEALGFAFEEASLRGVGLTALHAWQSDYFDSPGSPGTAGSPGSRGRRAPAVGSVVADEFQASELRVLAESIQLWTAKYPGVALAQRVVHDNPVTALVGASAGAELVVTGSRGRDGFRALLLGSVSHAVLHHAHCPVAVVRHRV